MKRLAWLALAACAAPLRPGMERGDVLAVIAEPTPRSRDALARALYDALGVQVMLADDALTAASTLPVERRFHEGRDPDRPELFVLVRSGPRCVLIHEQTQKRYPLPDTDCVEAR